MRLAERIAHISPSLTLKITAKAKQMAQNGIDVIGFGAGEPDYDTPEHIKAAAITAVQGGFTKYTPTAGIPELRAAICKKFSAENGLSYTPEQVVVGCGAKHSIYNLIQVLCNRSDEVIIPTPYWVSYPEMVKLADATPVFVKTEEATGFKLRPEDLKRNTTAKTKVLILNSPSNPTGTVYTKEELSWIAEWAVKHNVFVISDEIYEKLLYDGAEHVSIAGLNADIFQRTIVVNGVSKAYAMTGWRIGYFAGPVDVAKAVTLLQDHSTSNPVSISQKAALAALTQDQSFIGTMRRSFVARRDMMVSMLNAIPGIRCFVPKGAFYVFCNVGQLRMDSLTLADKLLEEAKVALVPGIAFGDDDYMRLSFATSEQKIETGIKRIAQWVKERRA